MDVVSHVDGRARIKYQNAYEMHLFLKNTKNIPGLKTLKSNDVALTILVSYEMGSPFEYVLKNIAAKQPDLHLSKDDVSAYVVPLLKSPMAKAFWLMTLFGTKIGFLQFTISSMLINKYIKAKFD